MKLPSASRGFVPRLEALEDRCLLAVSILTQGNVLTIRGDNNLHSILIIDDGTNLGSNITIMADGQEFNPDIAARVIRVRTGAGDDDVEYQLNQTLRAGVSRLVDVKLGTGHNQFTITMKGDIQAGANLAINYRGGPLDDTINGNIQDNFRAGSAFSVNINSGPGNDIVNLALPVETIAAGAFVNFNINGGAGDDRIFLNYIGTDEGRLTETISGGAGGDKLSSDLEITNQSSKIRGTVLASMFGGSDDDNLKLAVHRLDLTSPLTVNGILDGGPGQHNIGRHTANIKELNCQVDVVIP